MVDRVMSDSVAVIDDELQLSRPVLDSLPTTGTRYANVLKPPDARSVWGGKDTGVNFEL